MKHSTETHEGPTPEEKTGIAAEPVRVERGLVGLRSHPVQEILSERGDFLSRWGLAIFLSILVLLLAGSWYIDYPDIIQANAYLTAANAPKEIVIRQDGKLTALFGKNDAVVKKGQIIGWIESSANQPQVIRLSELLSQSIILLSSNNTEQVSRLFDQPFYDLGELQVSYQHFITAWQQFDDYLVNGYYYKRKKMLSADHEYLLKMHGVLEQQRLLAQQDLQLSQDAVNANDSLLRDSVISRQDMRDLNSKLLGKKLTIPQIVSSQLTNENQQIEKEKEVNELEHTISQQKIIFQEALQTLKSTVDDWMIKFIIRAPEDGKVVFVIPLQENQFVQSGHTIGYVNPGDSRYYALVNLPQNNFGKIAVGQKVQLRFDAYPYEEFGYVEGRLRYISAVPTDSGFLANVELPNGLVTNYHQNIQYRSGLRSAALIITKDDRLLNRFFYSIHKVSRQQ